MESLQVSKMNTHVNGAGLFIFNRRRHGRINAFTLIELLVVVAIISLLMAVLIPSLQKAKDRARAAKCGANLRNFGSAMQLYLGEFGGHSPAESGFESYMNSTANGVGAFPAWGKASVCAGTLGGFGDGFIYDGGGGAGSTRGASYGFYYPGNFNVARSKTPQDIVFAGDTIFGEPVGSGFSIATKRVSLYDQGTGLGSYEVPSKVAAVPSWNWTSTKNQPRFHARHGNTANIAWYDGHVSAEKLYRPVVSTSVDPMRLIEIYKQGILTPFPSSMSYSLFVSKANSSPNSVDYHFVQNAD